LTINTNSDKTQVIVKVLSDLMDGNWEDLKKYLYSPKQMCRDWLTRNINDEFFSIKNGTNRYQKSAKGQLRDISDKIKGSIDKARGSDVETQGTEISLADWLESFCSEEKKVGYAASDFSTMTLTSSTKKIKDIQNFITYVRGELSASEKRIRNHFNEVTSHNANSNNKEGSFNKAFNEMWGCEEQCPFCREFCRLGEKHEGKGHECLQHKPKGIRGIHWRKTKKLSTNSCSFAVQTETEMFHCSKGTCGKRGLCTIEDCQEFHRYSDYKKYLTDWNIFPSGDETEKTMFWAFMMHKYAKELTEHYGREYPDLPSPWKNITPEEAKGSLFKLSSTGLVKS